MTGSPESNVSAPSVAPENREHARPLAGQIAIVTGASSGIGAATARELARRGASVVLAARRSNELETEAARIRDEGGSATVLQADVSDTAQGEMLIRQTLIQFGKIDILVNNAGVGDSKPFLDMSEEEIEARVDVNLRAPILLTREALPGMIARRRGVVIFVASVAGHVAVKPIYSATKFGLRGFARALRRQLAGSGVAVSVVSPGYIRTQLTRRRTIPMPGPELIAQEIARLAERPRREVVRPRYYWLPIWFERVLPGAVDLALRPRRKRTPPAPPASPSTASDTDH